MQWTTDKPTTPGWYWWREPHCSAQIVLILLGGGRNRKRLFMVRLGESDAPPILEHVPGAWAGPIAEPEES